MCHNTPEGSGDEASNLTCLAKFDLPHGRGASPYGVASFQGFKVQGVCVCILVIGLHTKMKQLEEQHREEMERKLKEKDDEMERRFKEKDDEMERRLKEKDEELREAQDALQKKRKKR